MDRVGEGNERKRREEDDGFDRHHLDIYATIDTWDRGGRDDEAGLLERRRVYVQHHIGVASEGQLLHSGAQQLLYRTML